MRQKPITNGPGVGSSNTPQETIKKELEALRLISEKAAYEEKKERRQLAFWIIKMSVGSFIGVSSMATLALCYAVLFHNDEMEYDIVAVFGYYAKAVVEIVKFLMT